MGLFSPHSTRTVLQWSVAAYLLGTGAHSIWPWTKVPTGMWFGIVAMLVSMWVYAARSPPDADTSIPRITKRVSWKLFILFSCFIFGVLRFDSTIPGLRDGLAPFIGQSVSVSGRILSLNNSRYGTTGNLHIENVADASIRCPGCRVFVRIASHRGVAIGSRVRLDCKLFTPKEDPKDVVRRRMFARQGVWFECRGASHILVLSRPALWDILSHLAIFRARITARISRVLPRDEATLLSGILYGEQQLSDEQRDVMRRAGLMHLVAVSGSNVTIVVTLVFTLALKAGLRRRVAFWTVTTALALFVGFVGFSSSVLRAAVMGWFVLVAYEVGRIPSTDRLLLVAAAVLTLLNPWSLVFDAGFALSFLATWGLLVWTPLFQEKFSWLPDRFGVRSSVATTYGATLMTTPYLAWAFGRMSFAGLITNVFALPLIAWIMLLGAVTAAWGNMPGWQLISLPCFGLLRLLSHIAHISDILPWLDMRVPGLDGMWTVLLYLLLWKIWQQWRAHTDLSTRIQV